MAARWQGMCALLLAVTAACGGGDGTPTGTPPSGGAGAGVPVVVDTDLAIDDVVALAFLLSSTEVDVRAVTVSGTGEVRCPQGLTVIRALLAVTGDEKVPVACGRPTPLAGDHVFPTEWRDLADSGWGMDLSSVGAESTDRSAVDLLDTTLRGGGVALLTLGPLTNVAESFRADPDLAGRVSSIVVMGGAIDVPGNVAGEGVPTTAEWNIYIDPTAANEVLTSGAPVTLVGLDATNQLPITGDFLELLGVNDHTAAAKLADTLIRNNPQVYSGDAYFWDPLAAAVVVDPEVVATEQATITVVTTPGRDNGRTVRREDGAPVTIAGRPRGHAFEELLVRTLDQLGPGAAVVTPPPPVGRATIRYDGSTCHYDGPATVSSGRMRFTFETTDPAWSAAVVGLTGERSIERILAWIEAHHAEGRDSIPGIREVTPVPPRTVMYADAVAPRMAVICASEAPVPLVAGVVTVRPPG